MDSNREMYIYNIEYKHFQNLIDALNSGESWRDLGGRHLGFTHMELENFSRSCYRPEHSPAENMLVAWGRQNHTVETLFRHLHNMQHFQAIGALASHVPVRGRDVAGTGIFAPMARPLVMEAPPQVLSTEALNVESVQ